MCGTVALAGAAGAAPPAPVTYSASQTIPVPPASNYAGSGGGDGWGVAVGTTSLFNVFHHSGQLTVACHNQSDASACWAPRTITDIDADGDPGNGSQFATSGHPGMWLDQSSNKLYVYATESNEAIAGVVCIDTVMAATIDNPFCGFTELTSAGDGPLEGGISNLSEPVLSGGKWYAYNYVNGSPPGPAKNSLLCFDTKTLSACGGQPYSVPLGSGALHDSSFPEAQVAAIGGHIVVAANLDSGDALGCYDPSASAGCTGTWPVALAAGYASAYGAPFPMLADSGAVTGLCLPTGDDPCFDLSGASVATPDGLKATVAGTAGWNGNALTIGPRIYLPDGYANQVDCYSWATNASCPNFPKSFANLGLLYSVNPDPARPTCIWVNADNGSQQIQNFDAYTGGACGQGPIRVLASSFVVPTQQCQPATYTSLQVTEPPRSGYSTGSVAFQDADANQIPNVSAADLDATGTATLTGKNLSTNLGLPQFLITLTGATSVVGQVTVALTWTGVDDPSCVNPGTVVTGGGTGVPTTGQCGDGVFIAVAGNGEHIKTPIDLQVSKELKASYNALQTAAAPKKVGLRIVNYSAPAADQLTAGLAKLRAVNPIDDEAQVRAKQASDESGYLAGKDAAVAATWTTFTKVRTECPAGTKITLGGYSQGAAVVHEFLNQLAAGTDSSAKSAVVGSVLIADPERVKAQAVPEASDAPNASSGSCDLLSAVVSCVGATPVTDVAAPFAATSVSVCARGDAACDASDVLTSLVNAWSANRTASAKAQAAVLTSALKVHGGYQGLAATAAAGTTIGRILARS